MSNLSLFEQALKEYENKKLSLKIETTHKGKRENEEICIHANVIDENGIVTCQDCNEEIVQNIQHEKEWRYYGPSDTKRSSDPNRVQKRKSEERNIHRDVENLGFSDKVISKANGIYIEVTKGQIFRGNSRKAIIFACIFHSYKILGNPQSHENLIKLFGLNRRSGLKGIKHVNIHAPKTSEIHTTVITPVILVKDLMSKFKAKPSQVKEVTDLYGRIRNRSSKLNRSRPQSTSSGLIFYWIKLRGIDITIKEFAKKADLSELTITKIAKEIAIVLNTPDIV
jgi:transcription initiation factor TFIIIB Brf1 subunit/transcription initiation factor TFIIB